MVVGWRRVGLLVGFALPHVWLHAVSSLQSSGALPLYDQALYYLCMGGLLLVGSRLSLATLDSHGRLVALVDAGSALALCTIAFMAGGLLSVSALGAGFLLALGGLGTSWILLRWFAEVCRYEDRGGAVRFVLVSFVITAAARLVLVALPPWLVVLETAAVAAAPLVSIAALRLASETPAERLGPGAEVSAPVQNAVYLGELCLCALALGAFKLPVAASEYASLSLGINYALRMLVPVAILIALDSAPFKKLYRPIQGLVLVVLVGVLAFSLLGGDAVGAIMAEALLSLARNFALIVIYLLALQSVYCHGVSPFRAFGVARGVFDCSLGVGIAVSPLLGTFGFLGAPGTNVVLFCAGVVFLLVMNRLITYVYRYHVRDSESASAASLEDVCRELGRQHGLTDREEQVLQLLCKGFSKGHIAQKLQLSENTVRWHSKNLYEKLGVHSKQELLELVERPSA